MNRLQKYVASSLALAAALSPNIASAACTLADLAGTWQAYQITVAGGDAVISRCRLVINSAGKIADTTCVTATGGTGQLTNGAAGLISPSTCVYAAGFKFQGVVERVIHATLSRDKLTAEGMGVFSGGSFLIVLSKA